jgi:hypothetical protein
MKRRRILTGDSIIISPFTKSPEIISLLPAG